MALAIITAFYGLEFATSALSPLFRGLTIREDWLSNPIPWTHWATPPSYVIFIGSYITLACILYVFNILIKRLKGAVMTGEFEAIPIEAPAGEEVEAGVEEAVESETETIEREEEVSAAEEEKELEGKLSFRITRKIIFLFILLAYEVLLFFAFTHAMFWGPIALPLTILGISVLSSSLLLKLFLISSVIISGIIVIILMVFKEPILRLPGVTFETEVEEESEISVDGMVIVEQEPKKPVLEFEESVIETKYLQEPFVYRDIIQDRESGVLKYVLHEPELTEEEKEIYRRIVDILLYELKAPEELENPEEHFDEEARRIMQKYKFKEVMPESWAKIMYYVKRDLIGYGPIDGLMLDPEIEDISCDGVMRSIYVWHRKYESMPVNIIFDDAYELNDLVVKLVHKCGKHVSSAFPIMDGSLPNKHRLAVAYSQEVTPFGSSFTIRKFREDPFSIIDLVKLGTLSLETVAYLWIALEHRKSILVIGGTASGKTTLLNAIACLIKPGKKIITIEETPELNLPHENWVSMISRPSYGLGESERGEIELFDLVRTSLRHRPDYLVVGETRGAEAYVLFQAVATGHGGLATMHAENLDAAIKRLLQKPMDIAPAYIPLMNIAVVIQRFETVKTEKEAIAIRRVKSVSEIIDVDDYNTVFTWKAPTQEHVSQLKKSKVLIDIADQLGISLEEILIEVEKRKRIIEYMMENNIRSYFDVAKFFSTYYSDPDRIYQLIAGELAYEPILGRKDEIVSEHVSDSGMEETLRNGEGDDETIRQDH
ncbi:MAG: type II/IV secretion system ATPase subunit [Candidatus Geothermarchaeales archaeon]